MLITNGTIVTPGVRRRTIHRQVNLGPMSMRIVTIVIIAAAAIITIAQTTKTATANYTRHERSEQVKNLREDVARLQTEEVRLRALNNNDLVTNQDEPAASPTPTAKLEASDKINQLPSSSNQSLSQLPTSSTIQ